MKTLKVFCIIISFFLFSNISFADDLFNRFKSNKSFKDNISLKLNFKINSGISYSYFSSLLRHFNLKPCIGFHFGADLKLLNYRKAYIGFTIKYNYMSTKIGFADEEYQKYYNDPELEYFYPYSVNKNAYAIYQSFVFLPKIGIDYGKTKFTFWNLFWPYSLFTYAEIQLGFGKAWYDIDRFVIGPRNYNYFNDESARLRIEEEMSNSELLHILDNELVFSIGLKVGRNLAEKIRIGLSFQVDIGLRYRKDYGTATYLVFTNWGYHSETRRVVNRMRAHFLMLELDYQIF